MKGKLFSSTRIWPLLLVMLVIPPLVVDNAQASKNPKNEMSDASIHLTYPSTAVDEPKHAIIWLHGLGATADDFPPIVPELGLDPERVIKFIFPQAPNRPIAINAGMVMPGWYDIKGIDIADKQDAVGMQESQATVEQLITSVIEEGIPSSNIIIAGFSQGGAVAYHTALRSEHKLAGILAMSTYLAFADEVENDRSAVNKQIPIFASHGTIDPVVPVQLGQLSANKLESLGYDLKWKTYPMEHQVSLDQIRDIGQWINQTFDR